MAQDSVRAGILSRRLNSRVDAREEVWVYWGCNGREDVSRVRDLSLGGLFLETPRAIPTAASADLHFLVPEGEIRAEAVVRRAEPSTGLGLKLVTVMECDRARLSALVNRLQSLSRPRAGAPPISRAVVPMILPKSDIEPPPSQS